MQQPDTVQSGRLRSLDFTRGFIMVLLALESVGLYEHLMAAAPPGSFSAGFLSQFFHKGWHGWRFWDLIQPLFMFMAGVAMAYSLNRQQQQGITWRRQFLKILRRAALLIFWGLFKRISDPEWFAIERLDVTDILTQLAFTTLIAFLIFRLSSWRQALVCVLILLLTDFMYRYFSAPGYEGGYTDGGNVGNYTDWLLFNQKTHGYVFINWFPTAVHTIAGIMIGKHMSNRIAILPAALFSGAVLLLTGLILDWSALIPIIKPVATASFVLVSLACCLFIFSLFYYLIDKRNLDPGIQFFSVVGMNAIFIYLFFDIVGRNWLNGYVAMVLTPVLSAFGAGNMLIPILCSLATFAIEYGLCYFLYRRKIFFKL
ncbi:acyltransferase family protein [Pedobacter sp. SYP-B3415]|uniref:acyltransferase family protein n=1 Tax=Pedobacter sp. SYP-B3415 TaxID=2496641 RepID=UPI00197F157E|nr:heparan-alpha-glucosaminide N-acetyltransferase domain-containing protein [Pedobacter sp. SYP-B3415]